MSVTRMREKVSSLPPETVFDILSNQRRRYALHYLIQQGRPVELSDVANQVSAWENGVTAEAVTYAQRKRVYNALRQTHLPTMAEAGVVEFDRNRSVVEPTDSARELEVYLDVVAGNDIPWSTFYLGLSLLAAATTTLVLTGFPLFGAIPTSGWVVVIVFGFLLTSIVHAYADRQNRLGTDGPPPEIRSRK